MSKDMAKFSDLVVIQDSYDTKEPGPYEVNIDFDDASKVWRANKVPVGMSKSVFSYVCGAPKKNGEPCKAPPYCWCSSYRKQHPSDMPREWGPCRTHIKK